MLVAIRKKETTSIYLLMYNVASNVPYLGVSELLCLRCTVVTIPECNT